MADPVAAFGVIAGLAVGFLAYRSGRVWWRGVLRFVVTFLALGTPLHCILVPALAGFWANRLLYDRMGRNWAAFLVSLLGVFGVAALLSGTGRLYLTLTAAGPMGLGEALGRGIGMGLAYALFVLVGVASYALVSLGVSNRR